MPLKLVPPRPPSKNWSIRGTYLGRYVNRSTGASKRAVAAKVLRYIEQQIERGELASDPGEPTFASAALAYMNAGGDKRFLKQLLEHFGDTPLSRIDQAAVDTAAMGIYPSGSMATRNRQVYTPVCAVMRYAGIRTDFRRPRGAAGNKATAWLWPEQAEAIFEEARKLDQEFAALLILLCYTGMRLGEALGLTWENTRLQDGYAYLPDTKNGEPRAIFLPPVAVAALANVRARGTAAVVFGRWRKGGHLYSLLRAAAFRAGVDLPERSAFHLFRHTYATWMRRYAGLDTRGLVATGAWKDSKSADRYSHAVVTEEAQRAVMLPTKGRTG